MAPALAACILGAGVRAAPEGGEASGPADAARPPQTHALLLNGGGSAAKNYLSHLHHLQDMVAALRSREIPPERIHVFTADGDGSGQDLTARSAEPPDLWLLEGTGVGRALDSTDLSNTVWEGVTLRPARLGELRRWFARMSAVLEPGDVLLVFVTDHGSKNADDPENGLISLWNESLSVLEFRALLAHLAPGVRVVSVMSQCYSGAFADAMAPLGGRVPGGDACGFYSTTSDRPAYGCYPEGRDRDRIGHAFRFIDAMARHASLDDVHAAVTLTDTSPDVPVRSSDLFLERVLKDEAGRRKVGLEELVDELLASAWKERRRWEPQIRLLDRLGEVYGTFSPRTLAELKARIEGLQALSKEIGTYEDRWKLALDDLRKENLDRFLGGSLAWKERLDPRRLEPLDAAERKSMLAELLPALVEFTAGRADVSRRLRDLRGTDEDAKSAAYRVDVRLAALLRMWVLLTRVAGIQLLSEVDPHLNEEDARWSDPATRSAGVRPRQARLSRQALPSERSRPSHLIERKRALAALEACERSPIGVFDPGREEPALQETPEPLAPFEDDLAAVRRALPSWLGVPFRPVPDKQRERFEVERGAVMVNQVYPDTPAHGAGIQPGDLLLGPPAAHFTEPNQIREWTMTSPRGTPIALDVLRDGKTLQLAVSLAPYPAQMPELPAPPRAGDEAPQLGSLRMLSTGPEEEGRDLTSRRHMVFFWATWCAPCKSSLPELMAWSRRTGVPVLAVSDEDEPTIRKFLDSWTGPFPELVASDELRRSYLSYGVSGSPTFVLVDEHGKIEWRQVGYSARKGLEIPAPSAPGPAASGPEE